MGNSHNNNKNNYQKQSSSPPSFAAIRDKYNSIEEVQDALQQCGLESSNLVIGIDYTISNTGAGKNTFGGRSLHSINEDSSNPYQQVIRILGRTLAKFDDDNLIPVFGFGDKTTKDQSVFPFYPNRTCEGFEEVLETYEEITPSIKLGGPTSFAPLIRKTIEIVEKEQSYHILVIIADGQVTPDSEYCQAYSETCKAIVDAANYPISIILVGVGDGPWETMKEFDDELPQRKFDNFQFVEFDKEINKDNENDHETNFALAALMEIPEQYWYIRQLGLLN